MTSGTPASAAASRDPRVEYERRIHRVLAYIDAHLDEPLDLETLAAVAHFSAFHFHRLFRAWTDETLGDYLRRRRVEAGALRLLTQPGTSVLEVALAVGFGSGEAFARAFKLRFGAAPSVWREERNPDRAGAQLRSGARPRRLRSWRSPTHLIEDTNMSNVTLINMPPTPIAYFRHAGPYGQPIARFWADRVAPWMAENGLLARVRYGIAHDDPALTEPAKCRYDAGVAVDPEEVLSGQPMRTVLPGGRYACARFEGTVGDIDPAWQRLLSGWLPTSGLQLDARPFLEHYPIESKFDPATGVFDCNICIPVTALYGEPAAPR